MTLVTSIVPWQCTLNERLKKVHHVGVYLMKVHGLHWRAIWPLMKSPYNIPFWGPGAMYNPLERLNLPKNEKKTWKKITFWLRCCFFCLIGKICLIIHVFEVSSLLFQMIENHLSNRNHICKLSITRPWETEIIQGCSGPVIEAIEGPEFEDVLTTTGDLP